MNIASTLPGLGQFFALFLILTGSQAYGQSPIVQTDSYSGLSNGAPVSLTFNSFDISTGNTLNYVEVSLTNTTFSGWAQGTNTGTANENIYIHLGGDLTITAPANINYALTIADSMNYDRLNVAPGGTAGPFSYVNNPADIVNGIPTQTLSSSTSDLTVYTSADGTTITVTVTPRNIGVLGQASDSNDNNPASAQFTGSATVAGNVSLIYTYSAVPEPSTTAFWLIGFSMFLLGGRSYLKRRIKTVQT